MFYGLITNKTGQAVNLPDYVQFTFDGSDTWNATAPGFGSCFGQPGWSINCYQLDQSKITLVSNSTIPPGGGPSAITTTLYADPLYAQFDVPYSSGTTCGDMGYTMILAESHP